MAERRRTRRRYTHELYPHAEEGMTRPLADEVPYLYARVIGLDTFGTGRSGKIDEGGEAAKAAVARMTSQVDALRLALVADALLQGMTGDAAWEWADSRAWAMNGGLEIAWERAAHYGVPVDQIKPYPCGPEPDHHGHDGEPDPRGWRFVTRVNCKESECPDCTEPVPA